MSRRGFSGGGRGGGGGGRGGGGGSRPPNLSKASRDAEGNILIQRAAASNGLKSTWERIWYGPDNSHEDLCKSLVESFEMKPKRRVGSEKPLAPKVSGSYSIKHRRKRTALW